MLHDIPDQTIARPEVWVECAMGRRDHGTLSYKDRRFDVSGDIALQLTLAQVTSLTLGTPVFTANDGQKRHWQLSLHDHHDREWTLSADFDQAEPLQSLLHSVMHDLNAENRLSAFRMGGYARSQKRWAGFAAAFGSLFGGLGAALLFGGLWEGAVLLGLGVITAIIGLRVLIRRPQTFASLDQALAYRLRSRT